MSDSNSKIKYKERYIEDDLYYLKQLQKELNLYKSELCSTNIELTKGLGISRQKLVNFMQDHTQGLPIKRSNLIGLWDYLSDPERIKDLKISELAKYNRNKLRENGLKQLLEKSGFNPDVKTKSLFDREGKEYTYDYSNLKYQLKKWSQRIFFTVEKIILDRLNKEIAKNCISGQCKFTDREIFTLYKAIEENRILSSKIHNYLKIKVSDCQFKTLSLYIEDYLNARKFEQKILEDKLISIKQETEQELRGQSYYYSSDFELSPVIKVTVQCKLNHNQKKINWCSSSINTHHENMFAAIAKGMGYVSFLEMIRSSSDTLGKRNYSLIKASSSFFSKNDNQEYSAEWVGRSTIISTLQSTVNAASVWLSQHLQSNKNCHQYNEICYELAKIEGKMTNYRKYINGYIFRAVDDPQKISPLRNLSDTIIPEIKSYINKIKNEYPEIDNLFNVPLTKQYTLANLIGARLSNVSGDLTKAQIFLEQAKESLEEIKSHSPTKIFYEIEQQVYQFFSGDEELFSQANIWQERQKTWLQELQQYLQTENIDHGHYPGNLGINIYSCASEIYGRMGRISLSCGKDQETIRVAIENLHKAAYCSSRVGHIKRLVHWLANLSRAYIRIGDRRQATSWLSLAKTILGSDKLIDKTCSNEYKQSITAEINIAYGEFELHINKQCYQATNYFLKSLKGSVYLGFARLISENLYNLSLALSKDSEPKKLFENSFSTVFGDQEDLLNQDQGGEDNKISDYIISFLSKTNLSQDKEIISSNFKIKAQNIWDIWYGDTHPESQECQHPIAKAMENNSFMCCLN